MRPIAENDHILRVGLDHAAPIPLHTDISQGDFKGFEVDLMSRLSSELGFQLTHVVSYWKDIISDLREGKIDVICSAATITTDRAKDFLFSLPYLEFHLSLVTHKDGVQSLAELTNQKIGVRVKTEAEKYLNTKFPDKELILFDSNEEIYEQLAKRQIDALVDDSPIAFGFVQNNPELSIAARFPETSSQYAIMLNKDNLTLKNKIDEVISTLETDGFLNAKRTEWFKGAKL